MNEAYRYTYFDKVGDFFILAIFFKELEFILKHIPIHIIVHHQGRFVIVTNIWNNWIRTWLEWCQISIWWSRLFQIIIFLRNILPLI